MEIADINCRYLQELHNASALWVVGNEPQMILQLIGELQRESFKEGYNRAMEILQDNFKEIIGGKNNER